MTYVPDKMSGLAKSRVVGHRPAVEKFLKYFQIGVQHPFHVFLSEGEI